MPGSLSKTDIFQAPAKITHGQRPHDARALPAFEQTNI